MGTSGAWHSHIVIINTDDHHHHLHHYHHHPQYHHGNRHQHHHHHHHHHYHPIPRVCFLTLAAKTELNNAQHLISLQSQCSQSHQCNISQCTAVQSVQLPNTANLLRVQVYNVSVQHCTAVCVCRVNLIGIPGSLAGWHICFPSIIQSPHS